MRVRTGDHTYPEVPAKAEPAEDVLTSDFYTLLPQIRLTDNSTGRPIQTERATEVMLDGNDVASLVECAIRHPAANMRYAVLAAIWSHPNSFDQIFQFGLRAPPGFPEIRKIVADQLDKCAVALTSPAPNRGKPEVETLLPRMPLPAHLQGRRK
jgi:hypothetical protein